eukprot:1010921-Amphidinium_carterae.1
MAIDLPKHAVLRTDTLTPDMSIKHNRFQVRLLNMAYEFGRFQSVGGTSNPGAKTGSERSGCNFQL